MRFRNLAKKYKVIGDVRGPGLFIGADFVEDRKTKAPAAEACKLDREFALKHGLLTQFRGIGANVLELIPP